MLRVVTRNSPLALAQSKRVGDLLQRADPSLTIQYMPIQTDGDRWLAGSLQAHGGKGLFVKALENALLHDQADIAVHSCKDMPMYLPSGLVIPAICDRQDPRDAWISQRFATIEALPPGALVGTASLRRSCQIRSLRSDVRINILRGNIGTRLQKLSAYDGIILAVAGLERLGLTEQIRERLPIDPFLPAPGQGALVIECRADDQASIERVRALNDPQVADCVIAEQAFSRHLGGGCHTPVAAYATMQKHSIILQGMVGTTDGVLLHDTLSDCGNDPQQLGVLLAERLRAQGADRLLARDHHDIGD